MKRSDSSLSRRELLAVGAVGGSALVLGCNTPKPAGKQHRAPQDVVLSVSPLGLHWPTRDPFLFCAYHNDAYPAGNEQLGPATSLSGRALGRDFTVKDGWRMYHGDVVPGFPQHPHRGFETVTIVRRGLVDHADSLGATARYGQGDVQWMTAGRGIVHAEMFPLLERDANNPLELFQVWLNLPAKSKMVDPHFKMLWASTVPKHAVLDGDGKKTLVTVIAGRLEGAVGQAPPPASWAAHADSGVTMWTLTMDAGARFTLPAAERSATRMLYFFRGASASIAGRSFDTASGLELQADADVPIVAGPDGADLLLLQARPIGEPVARHGPFVMNTDAEIRQAYADYQRTAFGGWPWSSEDPVHPRDAGRFAKHVDGHVEKAT